MKQIIYSFSVGYTLSSIVDRSLCRLASLHALFSFSCYLQVFQGNSDRSTVVYNYFDAHLTAQVVQFWPLSFYAHPSMRVEIFEAIDSYPRRNCKSLLFAERTPQLLGKKTFLVLKDSELFDNHYYFSHLPI